jgi:hypothetical protein
LFYKAKIIKIVLISTKYKHFENKNQAIAKPTKEYVYESAFFYTRFWDMYMKMRFSIHIAL